MTELMSRHRELGLTDSEYTLICEKLDRTPNEVELAVFSLLWSEHCGYKHSKQLLKTLPVTGGKLLMGPGENAGAVAVGENLACAFKVESHNHPSAVEPFEGAATGVGGILRDVFAVGARPIALLDSLRFGDPTTSARSRYLLERAVAGIGHYGNSMGVPTVGGEIYFEDPYDQNCLINVMCLGLIERDALMRSAAAGIGNVVVLFGARTGRDGIGGASVLASAELAEGDSHKRPSVQIGDPFEEKKLLECSLDLLERGLLVSLQDLGAAGLSSASAEMASKGEVGIDLDVSKIPMREPDMEPFELMVSESQERMLCVVEPEQVAAVLKVCEHWDVNATAIGEVTATRQLRVFSGEELVGDMSVSALVDDCPTYALSPKTPTEPIYPAPRAQISGDLDTQQTLLALLASPNIASRRWAFEQYDSIVGSRTVRRPEQTDAAVLLLHPENSAADPSAIAVAIDCNGRRVACDPYWGTVEAVVECSANLACVGAEPLGLTNCLNFGNPEKPHIAWQFERAITGLGDACRAFEIPVVGGNVSLYNESPDGPIYPTPVVGLVGELPDAAKSGSLGFKKPGDTIALVKTSSWTPTFPGSELAKLQGDPLPTELPSQDLEELVTLHTEIRKAVRTGSLTSTHDIAEGGLATALAECCIAGNTGAEVALENHPEVSARALLFGECAGAFIVSGPAKAIEAHFPQALLIGKVDGGDLKISTPSGEVHLPTAEMRHTHSNALERLDS